MTGITMFTSAALKAWTVDDPALGDALGAGGADVVLAQDLQHGGAGQPAITPVATTASVTAGSEEVRAGPAGRRRHRSRTCRRCRKPAGSMTAKTRISSRPEPEGRRRDADQHDERDGLVGPAVLPDGGDDAGHQTEDREQRQAAPCRPG